MQHTSRGSPIQAPIPQKIQQHKNGSARMGKMITA